MNKPIDDQYESRTIDADLIKEIQEYGIDVDNNTIYLEGHWDDDDEYKSEVSWMMARKFRKNLRLLEQAIAESGGLDGKSAVVDIDTPGGLELAGMSICNAIQESKIPLIGYVTGQASSMGCVILQAFKDRVLSPWSQVMYHSGTSGDYAPSQEYESAAKCTILYNKKLDDFVYSRVLEKQPNLNRDKFDLAVMRGLYFHNPQDAIDFGLADRISTVNTRP